MMSAAHIEEGGCGTWSNEPSAATTKRSRACSQTEPIGPSAEDAVQDACLKAWRDLPSLRAPDRYDAWLRRLLVRACLDQVRRRRRRPSEVALLPVHAAPVADVSEQLANVDQLEHAFSRLSVDHRAVVVLSHFEDLSMSEIAATLGIPVGTVKSRLHHALRAMRGAIEADERRSAEPRGETA
jgi:RNA polymerase sigma-70 factor (ECF subfamily)